MRIRKKKLFQPHIDEEVGIFESRFYGFACGALCKMVDPVRWYSVLIFAKLPIVFHFWMNALERADYEFVLINGGPLPGWWITHSRLGVYSSSAAHIMPIRIWIRWSVICWLNAQFFRRLQEFVALPDERIRIASELSGLRVLNWLCTAYWLVLQMISSSFVFGGVLISSIFILRTDRECTIKKACLSI